MIRIAVVSCLLILAGVQLRAEDPSLDVIRQRIAAIEVQSVQSAGSRMVVSGPDSLRNSMLLCKAESMAESVSKFTGIPLSFDLHSVRILVQAVEGGLPGEDVRLVHVFSMGIWIHRVVLPDYAAAETDAGREALCAAFFYVYGGAMDPSVGAGAFALPDWLRRGAARVLTVESRQATLDTAVRLRHAGRLPPPMHILAGFPSATAEDEDVQDLLTACGAFVVWFAEAPNRADRFKALFRRLAAGRAADVEWLRDWSGGGDPDQQWEHWLGSQQNIVRRLGTLTQWHLDTLRAEWLLNPSRCGIPPEINLPLNADCMALAVYRGEPWFTAVIREKRYRIEMLAPGRPERFRNLTAAYIEVLDGVLRGDPVGDLEDLATAARWQWESLQELVSQAGGEWTEP